MNMSCRVCGGKSLEEVIDLGRQPHCNSLLRHEDLSRPEHVYPLRLMFCQDCTTVQIDYTVPKEIMFSDYLYLSGSTRALSDHFCKSASWLQDRLQLKPGALVVDIGSNDGTWLKHFQDLGLRGLGVEPAANVATIASAAGVETLVRFFNADVAQEILQDYGTPKLVTAAGVFFHLEELHSAAEGVALLCRNGAVFCVQAIYLPEMIRRNAFDNIYHEHLTYWTLRSFEYLLSQHGLEVFEAEVVPIHGGSMQLLIGSKGAHSTGRSVEYMRQEEAQEGMNRLSTYREFAAHVQAAGGQLKALLQDAAAAGQRVHAYGAPAKGATLLNSFAIGADLVPVAEEVNPLKVGRYMPGCHIPIVQEGSVPEPDAFLVLPWNFLGSFLRKKCDYFARGGKFIVPLPEAVVIDASNYQEWEERSNV